MLRHFSHLAYVFIIGHFYENKSYDILVKHFHVETAHAVKKINKVGHYHTVACFHFLFEFFLQMHVDEITLVKMIALPTILLCGAPCD